jgi:hypothetical protein
VTSPATEAARPGIAVGPTSEFTVFFHFRPGHEREIREAIATLQASPGYRPGDYDVPIAVIHEARFLLFDDDTRLLFATSFDGPWDSYMVDFASKPLHLFDGIFEHVVGYEGLPDLDAVKRLDVRRGPYEWQDWAFEWTVTRPGRHTLRARATDAAGNVQPTSRPGTSSATATMPSRFSTLTCADPVWAIPAGQLRFAPARRLDGERAPMASTSTVT